MACVVSFAMLSELGEVLSPSGATGYWLPFVGPRLTLVLGLNGSSAGEI